MRLDRKQEELVLKQCRDWGDPLPDYIRNAPELLPGLELYMQAFHRLSTCRQVGMGLGPVPWTAVVQYGSMQELGQDQLEALHYHMARMDEAYLGYLAETQDKK